MQYKLNCPQSEIPQSSEIDGCLLSHGYQRESGIIFDIRFKFSARLIGLAKVYNSDLQNRGTYRTRGPKEPPFNRDARCQEPAEDYKNQTL